MANFGPPWPRDENQAESSAQPSSPVLLYPKREPPPPDRVLLTLTDRVRTSLRECQDLGARGPELMRILGSIVKSEADGIPMIGLHSIMNTHLDKLLLDMANKAYQPKTMSMQHRADVFFAESLIRQWRKRFGEKYEDMDKLRYHQLTEKGGALDGIEFNSDADPNSMDMWAARTISTPSEISAEGDIKEGRWWPTLACVQRDGVALNTVDTSMKGRGGITALPLLKGSELAYFPSATVKYVREGTMADMYVPLMTKVGSKMMIFRGHCLQSPFAPEVGVRYDGQYILRQYSQRFNPQTEMHRLTLRLERISGQRPMHELCTIPQPSQIDEWRVFDDLEGDMIKRVLGSISVMKWKLAKVKYSSEKKQFQNKLQAEYEAESNKGKGKEEITVPVEFTNNERTESTAPAPKFSDLKWEN